MQNKLNNENKTNALLDDMDRMILNEIQSNLPIEPRPYQVLAEKLRCSEEEVLRRVQEMKDRDVIRRILESWDTPQLFVRQGSPRS